MPVPASPEPPASTLLDATRDPADMTADQRRQEVATILAKGVLRLRQRAENAPGSRPQRTPDKSAESAGKPLMRGRERAFM
jgi:hypothetical protein